MEKRALPYIQAELLRLHANSAQMLTDESELEFLKVVAKYLETIKLTMLRRPLLKVMAVLFSTLQVCQQLPEYGVLFHRVIREKRPSDGEVVLGVCAKGVIVYEVKDGCRSTAQNFFWRETATISSSVREPSTVPCDILTYFCFWSKTCIFYESAEAKIYNRVPGQPEEIHLHHGEVQDSHVLV